MTSGLLYKTGFLAAAGLIEYALQFALPVVLVRYLPKSDFGEYRLVWLLASTGLILFPLFTAQSLFYFLPRATTGDRPKLVGNVFVSLLALGAFSVLLLLITMPIFPAVDCRPATLFATRANFCRYLDIRFDFRLIAGCRRQARVASMRCGRACRN